MDHVRRVRVLINPRSGTRGFPISLQRVLQEHWENSRTDLTYQISNNVEDGRAKARRAVADGVDTILIAGGDGMVNSIGGELAGTDTALGVIPTGSGNGFARHFGVPLEVGRAVAALARAGRRRIDVGVVNGRPFFVTCSMAWDGALVKRFEKSPVRGILPYVFAAAYELFEYRPQPFTVRLDDRAPFRIADPFIFTAANLTQYGGGARVAPHACADDGYLELVVVKQADAPWLVNELPRLFDGTFDAVPCVQTHRFRRMTVRRPAPAPIQLDGELIEAPEKVVVEVRPRALSVLVPEDGGK